MPSLRAFALCVVYLSPQSPSYEIAEKVRSYCIFGGGELVRFKCSNCELIFGPLKVLELTPAQLSSEYEWHYKCYAEGDSTESEIRAFQSLAPIKGKKYLNYGAGGWSKSISVLSDQGWQVMGYEPHLSPNANSPIITSESELKLHQFDGIFSNNLIEHLQDPVASLNRMREQLSPDGQMAHATPCYDYLYEYTRFHLFFFGQIKGGFGSAG